MKSTMLAAILLIAIGIISFGYQGFTYTTREKVIDIGPIKATADKEHTVPLPPIIGALALAGGVALLISSKRG